MIPVTPAPEPPAFDRKVRQPGLRAIAELAGAQPDPPRTTGRPYPPVAASRDEIPAGKFPPYWREMLDDLMESYHRICAHLCLYIPRGTGAPSVDHAVAKSQRWDQVYEWSNYRLACSLMNARKGLPPAFWIPFKSGKIGSHWSWSVSRYYPATDCPMRSPEQWPTPSNVCDSTIPPAARLARSTQRIIGTEGFRSAT